MILRTMDNDWEPESGPRGKPYADCPPRELLGTPSAQVGREYQIRQSRYRPPPSEGGGGQAD
jgi:hypothetical protein